MYRVWLLSVVLLSGSQLALAGSSPDLSEIADKLQTSDLHPITRPVPNTARSELHRFKNRPASGSRSLTARELFQKVSAGVKNVTRPNRRLRRPHTPVFDKKLNSASPVRAIRRDSDSYRLFKGQFKLDSLATDETIDRFLSDRPEVFGLKSDATSLQSTKRWKTRNSSHHRYQRAYKGVPVWGSQVVVHNNDDHIFLINGDLTEIEDDIDVHVDLDPMRVITTALEHLQRTYADLALDPSVQKVIYRLGSRTFPAAKLELLFTDYQSWLVFIDLRTNRLVHKINNTKPTLVSASGQDLSGTTRQFDAWEEGGLYFLENPNVPAEGTIIWDIRNQEQPPLWRVSSTDRFSGWDPAGVSAFINLRIVHDYYLQRFERESLNDAGQALIGVIHYGDNYDGAFWTNPFMVFGDGGSIFSNLAGCLDVVAHEVTHGVIENESNLIYQNQSGALNESFADVFAAMVDDDDWLLGENCTNVPPFYLRSLSDPNSGLDYQPQHMSDYQLLPNTEAGDNGGVHINSGIPNRAAYLLAEGLTNENLGTSIGKTKTESIFYETMRMLTPTSEFIDASVASLSIAEQLYGEGSSEAQAVQTVWNQVGVNEELIATPTGGSTEVESVSGDDVMVYLYPVDGTHDSPFDPEEEYQVYMQIIPNPFEAYDSSLDFGPLNIEGSPRYSPPAPITLDGIPLIFYIGTERDVWLTSGITDARITETGGINSITTSPDGNRVILTFDGSLDIVLLDIANNSFSEFEVRGPTYIQDATANFITAVDSVGFDYSGRKVIFDYSTCAELTDGPPCSSSEAFDYWSIGILDLETGRFTYPFPTQTLDFDLGFPKFARNSNQYIVFDLLDWSDFSETNQAVSSVLLYDIVRQHFELAGISNISDIQTSTWGVPSFSGDDDYIIHQVFDDAGGFAVRTPVNDFVPDLLSFQTLNSFDVALPVAHRVSTREVGASLVADETEIDFGNVFSGSTSTRKLTLRNSGNREIAISNISTENDLFSHNLVTTILQPDASTTYNLRVSPVNEGDIVDSVIIENDGDSGDLVIPVTAAVSAGSDADADGIADHLDSFPDDPVESADTDGDGIGNREDTDDDNDGMSDNFEIRHGLDPESNDAADDRDGDGISNLEEFESATRATQYLMTTSASSNVTFLHIVNTSDEAQLFSGTLYSGDGERLGNADTPLNTTSVPANGRLILTAVDLENLFSVEPWTGPAMLEVAGAGSFQLMSKLISPSGLVSNTNCVRDEDVHNIEGFDSDNLTFVRFLNTTVNTMSDIRGALHSPDGNRIGADNLTILDTLAPKQAVWISRQNLSEIFGSEWNGVASLYVEPVPGLKLLNLNFVNSETFFNFSCFEDLTNSTVFLQTTSNSINISYSHIVNTSSQDQSYRGTLYNGNGEQLGSARQLLHEGVIPSKGRLVLSSEDLESIFNVAPWSGPAMLEVSGNGTFELMTKLTSPSGLISNSNCVRESQVHNIEGFDSEDRTFVRFINTGSQPITNVRGSLYDKNGASIGLPDTLLISSLESKSAEWLTKEDLASLFGGTWNSEALLSITNPDGALRLINLNFVNKETFFNFSCYETLE